MLLGGQGQHTKGALDVEFIQITLDISMGSHIAVCTHSGHLIIGYFLEIGVWEIGHDDKISVYGQNLIFISSRFNNSSIALGVGYYGVASATFPMNKFFILDILQHSNHIETMLTPLHGHYFW